MNEFSSHSSSGDESARAELESSIRRGTRWVLLAQVVSQFVSFAVLAALYRLVGPDNYGLLGMVMPLLVLAKVFAASLNVATIQERRLADGQLSTVFWVSVLVSLVTASVVVAGGPLLARLYETPQLTQLVAALAGTLVVATLGAQHQALMERKLQIGRVTAVRLTAQLVGGLAAVAAAWARWGVWALVVQQYVELVVLAALVWRLEPWRPLRWSQCERARHLLRFGGFYSLSSLMFFVAQNSDKIIIALLLGATRQGQVALGLYSQAFSQMMKPVYLVTSPITSIMLPSLSRLAHQQVEFEALVSRFYRMIAILLFPCSAGLTVVALDLMLVLGGEPWRPAGVLLTVLAPVILVQGLLNISGSVFAAAGHAKALFWGATVTASVMVGAVLLGIWSGGLWSGGLWGEPPYGSTLGVARCYSLATLVLLALPYLTYCFRTVQISPRSVLTPLLQPLGFALAMGALAWATRFLAADLSHLPRLVLVVVVGVVAYTLLARREIRWLLQQLRAAQ